MGGVISSVTSWVNEPFVGSVSIGDLFLMTGMVLVFIMAWMLILYHIRIAAETI